MLYVQCAQYESIEVARPVKVTSTQPSQEMYSEVLMPYQKENPQ